MDIIVRAFKKEDAPSVSRLIGRNLFEVNIKDYSLEEMQRLANEYSEKRVIDIGSWAHSHVVCLQGQVIGCGSIAKKKGKDDESYLLCIFVLPEFHAKGIGARIMEALENDVYFLDTKRVELSASITACGFYEKLGYKHKNGKRLDENGLYIMEKVKQ